MPAKAKYLSEQEIIQYCKDNNIDPSICYCKECGKFLAYDNAVFHINSVTKKIVCDDNKLSFLSTRNYNGNEYHLCRCYDCVCEKFPNFKDVRFKFAHKAAKYTQYGFGVPDEDFKPVCDARQSVTKEKMIKKYGITEGTERWNSYCKKQADSNKFEYKHEKHGMTYEEYDEYNKSRAVTLDNMIKRYGVQDGLFHWNQYVERQRYTCTLEYFIEKYGDTIGIEKYNDFVEKRNTSNRLFGPSAISLEMFDKLIKNYKNNIVYYDENEYSVHTNKLCLYHVDYYDKTLNIIIEFYGDFFHLNPKIYDADFIQFKHHEKAILAKNRWQHDKERINDIQQTLNCKVIIVWESTYKNGKKGTINSLIQMINNKEQLNDITEI